MAQALIRMIDAGTSTVEFRFSRRAFYPIRFSIEIQSANDRAESRLGPFHFGPTNNEAGATSALPRIWFVHIWISRLLRRSCAVDEMIL
jgi:hypothetical protein